MFVLMGLGSGFWLAACIKDLKKKKNNNDTPPPPKQLQLLNADTTVGVIG